MTAYQVNLFNAAGGLVYTFNFAPDPTHGASFNPNEGYFVLDPVTKLSILTFYNYPNYPASSDRSILQLVFSTPFAGIGAAIPYSPSNPVLCVFGRTVNSTSSRLAVSSAVSSVPAPPSLILVGIAGLTGLGRLGVAKLGRSGSPS